MERASRARGAPERFSPGPRERGSGAEGGRRRASSAPPPGRAKVARISEGIESVALSTELVADLTERARNVKYHPVCSEVISSSSFWSGRSAEERLVAESAQLELSKLFAVDSLIATPGALAAAEARGKVLAAHNILMDSTFAELGAAVQDSLPFKKSTLKGKGAHDLVLSAAERAID